MPKRQGLQAAGKTPPSSGVGGDPFILTQRRHTPLLGLCGFGEGKAPRRATRVAVPDQWAANWNDICGGVVPLCALWAGCCGVGWVG